jgi:transposase
VYLGVDIAKSYLDMAIGNEKRRFANDAAGHRELINWIKQMEASVQVICEPGGGYEGVFVQAVARAQINIALVQANRMRQFARAAGILAKIDRIDAEVLCALRGAKHPSILGCSR